MTMDKDNPRESGPGKPASLWEIERLLLGEIQGEEAVALRSRIASSPELQSYLERSQGEGPRRDFADFKRFRKERLGAAPEILPIPIPQKTKTSQKQVLDWRRLLNRVLPGGPRLAYGLTFALLLGVTLWQFRADQGAATMENPPAFSAKGGEGMEILLKVAGREVEAGESADAGAGDTLAFSYRSPASRHVQIWYREDTGLLIPFSSEGDSSSPWSSATRWTSAPQRILLEGRWSRQEIWVVGSKRLLTPDEAKAVVEGVKGAPDGSKAWVFRLKQDLHPAP